MVAVACICCSSSYSPVVALLKDFEQDRELEADMTDPSTPANNVFTFATPNLMGPDPSTPRVAQPPRPANAWILYRSDKIKELPPVPPGAPRRPQSDVSKMISRMWKEETDAVKAIYEKRAELKKAEHQARYPNYRFQPAKKSDKATGKAPAQKKKARASPYPTQTILEPAPVYGYANAPSPPLSAASSAPPSPIHDSSASPLETQASDWSRQTYTWDSSAQPSPPRHLLEQKLHLSIEPPQEFSNLTFEMPSLPEQQNWNSQGSADSMQAMLSATADPSIFQMSFDPAMLTHEPPAGFDITYAPIQDPTISNAWLPSYDHNNMYQAYNQQQLSYPQQEQQISYHEPQQQQRIISNEITPEQQEEMMSYINFNYPEDPYSSNSSVASLSRVSSVSTAPPSTPIYVPPSGAFNFGRRIVAGSWKTPTDQDDCFPPGSPIHASNNWGLQVIS